MIALGWVALALLGANLLGLLWLGLWTRRRQHEEFEAALREAGRRLSAEVDEYLLGTPRPAPWQRGEDG